MNIEKKNALIDASMIITEACVQSGAGVFVGYPITPSNRFYSYGQQRFPSFWAGPDEISVLQWMVGFSAAGKFPVTATAFPGLALMVETLNMAFMMEIPLVIILTQRLGPSTGSATTGAQGDLKFLEGIISGGYPIPVISPSNFEDAWNLTNKSIDLAVKLRTPVILLTSKEMVMTEKSFDISGLPKLEKVVKNKWEAKDYMPYKAAEDLIPPFLPLGDETFQVRFNASTHDNEGLIRKGNPESMANTKRLQEKYIKRISEYTYFDLDAETGADDLIITYGISSDASRDAVTILRKMGRKVSLLIVKTILPIAPEILDIMDSYKRLIFVEENISGQYKEIVFGKEENSRILSVNKIGSMIDPSEIVKIIA